MELLMTLTGTRMTHVPYKGSGPALVDLMGGHIALLFTVPSSVVQHMKSGKVKALAITSAQRSAVAPELATISESGVPGFVSETWAGMLAPAGAPMTVVEKLAGQTGLIIRRPEIRERFLQLDIEPVGSTPAVFTRFMRDEVVKWGKVIKEANVKPEQ
ncbi:MAG: tripartite tricarboxylate transporter substrate binding protein, partial [Betaproteobacteria bacterium]|nr:tripartite tricarboxylate transporter substrate binding protein [Betaproteobacteria bacterium]